VVHVLAGKLVSLILNELLRLAKRPVGLRSFRRIVVSDRDREVMTTGLSAVMPSIRSA
jgi:hypothetical protein